MSLYRLTRLASAPPAEPESVVAAVLWQIDEHEARGKVASASVAQSDIWFSADLTRCEYLGHFQPNDRYPEFAYIEFAPAP